MRQSALAQEQLQATIDKDIAERIKIHQAQIDALKVGQANLLAANFPARAKPLVMLAHGDSWFDYPLTGNGLPLTNTDVIAQLATMGNVQPLILNMSHHGDATTDELSLPKQERMIQSLRDGRNWPDGKPDAILFSGGGNDIAGEQFCIFLDYAAPNSTGLDNTRFNAMLNMVQASYLDLIDFRDRYAPGVPIFTHGYDFPIPDGRHPMCAGPWLRPSLLFAGWTDMGQGAGIVKTALQDFQKMLSSLAANTPGFFLVPTQGTLKPSDWANELHPIPDGFKAIAAKFLGALQGFAPFQGRI
jgi:hypothetical protein